jgi:hypothetical protein
VCSKRKLHAAVEMMLTNKLTRFAVVSEVQLEDEFSTTTLKGISNDSLYLHHAVLGRS